MTTAGGIAGTWITNKYQNARQEKQGEQNAEAQIIDRLTTSWQTAIQVLQSELLSTQKMSDRYFDLLDRNTRALETLVGDFSQQNKELTQIQGKLDLILRK